VFVWSASVEGIRATIAHCRDALDRVLKIVYNLPRPKMTQVLNFANLPMARH
jgi:hypothetical protein